MQAALDALWPYHHELFMGDAVDAEMVAAGIGFDPAQSKVYRHPTFFPMPEEVKGL